MYVHARKAYHDVYDVLAMDICVGVNICVLLVVVLVLWCGT